jgi:hypothetical protein
VSVVIMDTSPDSKFKKTRDITAWIKALSCHIKILFRLLVYFPFPQVIISMSECHCGTHSTILIIKQMMKV